MTCRHKTRQTRKLGKKIVLALPIRMERARKSPASRFGPEQGSQKSDDVGANVVLALHLGESSIKAQHARESRNKSAISLGQKR